MIGTLDHLIDLMKMQGAVQIYAKRLAPNDNSKNQIYLGGDFSALNVLPHGEIYIDADSVGNSKRDRAKASLQFYWLDENAQFHAPNASLILYPKYPEVRMSGFLKGCPEAPSRLMASREEGRILFLGITARGDILGHATDYAHAISSEFSARLWPKEGVFQEVPIAGDHQTDTKTALIAKLRGIYEQCWVASQKLSKNQGLQHYAARNGGGFTLEALLGVVANSKADPDFLGWEIKQYGVADFVKFAPKSPVTLFTPEPNYVGLNASGFVRKFGYIDKSGKPDRLNFGGVYSIGKNAHPDTGLSIALTGFDAQSGKITDIEGGLHLVDQTGQVAAEWKFTSLIDHWNRKHAKAAYVPSLFRTPPPEYAFGSRITLCERTDFILFLKAFSDGYVYYDPALKLENANDQKPVAKARSQFRIKHSQIASVYHSHEIIDLAHSPQ